MRYPLLIVATTLSVGCKSKSITGSCTADDVKLLNDQKLSETSKMCQECLNTATVALAQRCDDVCPSDPAGCAKCVLDGMNGVNSMTECI